MEQEHNDKRGGERLLAECIAARLCHDLAAPVAVLLNGLQTIEEDAGEFDEETLALLLEGARRAQARLRLARGLFGPASAAFGSLDAVAALVDPVLAERRVTACWQAAAGTPSAEEGRVVALGLLVGLECLPRGGRLEVACASIRISGERVTPPEGLPQALAGDPGAVAGARLAPALMLGRLLADGGRSARLEESQDGLTLSWS